MSKLPLPDLGAYLREQRESAQLSLRQLAEMAGVSNPYLSQIERGLKRPSAEILQQIAKGLQVSAESLYVRAGILDERVGDGAANAAPDPASRALKTRATRATSSADPRKAASPRRSRPSPAPEAEASPDVTEKEK